ncbi:MAG: DNA alkylation repair protein [Armatimonadota bacterium]
MNKIIELSDFVMAELQKLADPKRAEGEKRYFKNTINPLGVSHPAFQSLEKKVFKDIKNDNWTCSDAMEFAEIMLNKRVFEYTLFSLEFLSRYVKDMDDSHIKIFKKWLEDDLLDNWAAVDTLCPHIIGEILNIKPELMRCLDGWSESNNRWVRRASAVSFVLLARKGKFLDDCYKTGVSLFADKDDDLVQKGNGWMLREAGKTDMERLEVFLLKYGHNIPRTTLRYAIEKFPKEKRAYLLQATKPQK